MSCTQEKDKTDNEHEIEKKPSSGPFTNLDHSYMWYTEIGGWYVQTCFFGGLVECWAPGRRGRLEEMEGVGIEHQRGKRVPKATEGMLGVCLRFSTSMMLSHGNVVADAQTAAAAAEKFTAQATPALPLLDLRALISPLKSRIVVRAYQETILYWNMAANDKLRSGKNYIPEDYINTSDGALLHSNQWRYGMTICSTYRKNISIHGTRKKRTEVDSTRTRIPLISTRDPG